MGTMTAISFPSLEDAVAKLNELLARARQIKPQTELEPPLPAADFTGEHGLPGRQPNHNALVETAARRLFQATLCSNDVRDPAFVDVWNLLDILSICGDQGQCEASLAWALIEELLDSQMIEGCRIVFNYLDSRRERLTSKDFDKKKLTVLRTCNELLRRLSRAEDTVFCGRVYIFLFQSFPLGDKSSVNLRGEFHTENVTTFEAAPKLAEPPDIAESNGDVNDTPMPDPEASTAPESVSVTVSGPDGKAGEAAVEEKSEMSIDELYPVFWTLQKAFSNPPTVFESQYLDDFKSGLEATLSMFQRVPRVIQAAPNQEKASLKRKAGEAVDDFASTYNPKYLTSRELFSLELSDLAFQRHILVQALILIDFLLSLTEKSRGRLANVITQRALQYSFTLSDADIEWAQKMRLSIRDHLQAGESGKFYYRMVETVLSRDKNWVRWKMEGCPPIAKPPVEADQYLSAKTGARSTCTSKRIRPVPMGSLDLKFLTDAENVGALQQLQEPDRYDLPTADTLMKGIENDALDLDMAMTDEEKTQLQEAKQNKTWRLLRLMARSKLDRFNALDDGQKLGIFFKQTEGTEPTNDVEEGKDSDANVEDTSVEGVKSSEAADESQMDQPSLDTDAPAAPALESNAET